LEEDPSTTLRTVIIARWRHDDRLGVPGSALEKRRIALLFGEGGDYTEGDLRTRAQMLNLLESQVSLTSQYLEQFLRELLSQPIRWKCCGFSHNGSCQNQFLLARWY